MTTPIGRWRITWMETWDQDFVDSIEPGHFRFDENGLGYLSSVLLKASLTTAFQKAASVSISVGRAMMRAMRNLAVAGLSSHPRVPPKGAFSFTVGMSQRWKWSFKPNG